MRIVDTSQSYLVRGYLTINFYYFNNYLLTIIRIINLSFELGHMVLISVLYFDLFIDDTFQ